MISAFKHIRLSGYNLLPQSVDGKTRLTLNSSGVAYFSELSTASGILNTKINDFSGTFQSFVNNLDATYATDASVASLSGTLTGNYYLKSNPSGFITSENVLYTTGNQTIVGSKTFTASRYVFSGADVIFTNNTGIVSGEWRFANRPTVNGTGVLLSGEAATPQNLATTGSTLDTKINSLSGTLTTTYATIENLALTGSNLQTQINNLDSIYATDASVTTVANNLGTTGANLLTGINAVATNLAATGSTLQTQINAINTFTGNLDATFATDASVTTVANNLSTTGANLLTGINAVATNLAATGSANLTRINSLSGTLTSTYATISNLALTGSNLQTQIDNLDSIYATDASVTTVANNLGTTGANLLTGINAVATNLAATGSNLQTQINNLDSIYATDASVTTVANNLGTTGANLLTGINAVATNLAATGSTLNTRISSLSGTLTSDYVQKATQQQFIVTLPINVESTGITFPVAFASTPNSVQVTFEPSTDVAYMVAVKNRTTAGFTAEFSDVIFETGNKLNVFASV